MEAAIATAGHLMLLDTSVFVDAMRNYAPAASFFSNLPKEGIFFSALTETELIAGAHCDIPEYRERTLRFLAGFHKVVVDNRIATVAGDLKRKYHLDVPDAIIAASAIVSGAVLLTMNTNDFAKITELDMRKPY